jgi:uncharacterized protein (DUF2252 family)
MTVRAQGLGKPIMESNNSNDSTSRAARRGQGKELRKKCSRSSQGEWKPRSKSQDIIRLLEESDTDRITGLVPLKYQRMSVSPFTFFRGTAIIQARDLANANVSGITVQACGDCHLANFGGFASPERKFVFDINDFDETYPGPWEWDIKRLGASLILAARDRSFSKVNSDEAVRAAATAYRERMAEFAEMKVLDRWYAQVTVGTIQEHFRNDLDMSTRLSKKHKQSRSRNSEAVFPKLAAVVNGVHKIKDDPPVLYHLQSFTEDFEKHRAAFVARYKQTLHADRRCLYERYRYQDSAVKVVGVGSVGTRCYVSLLLGDDDDPLFLQFKEARRSVLEMQGGKSRYANQGQRVVEGQRLMQAASDIFLGWTSTKGHDYYVRQLRDMKVSAEIETFKPSTLIGYATMCGWALARAHAKTGPAASIAGYLGSSEQFDDALAQYSEAYADQAEQDFKTFQAAFRSGRLLTKPAKESDLRFSV